MFRTKSALLVHLVDGLDAGAAFRRSGPGQKDKEKTKSEKKELTGTPVMWRDPADIESRNLLLGAGGEEMKPDISKITYIEEKTGGYSKKYRVRDAKGNEWIAKIGKEAQT